MPVIIAAVFGIGILLHFFAFLVGLSRIRSIQGGREPEGISVIKPVKGVDAEAYENFKSFCCQQLSVPYELIFALQDPQDPALPLIEKLKHEYPEVDIRITVNPVKHPWTGKCSNLYYGLQLAKYDCLVLSDADMRVAPDFISRITSQLYGRGLGLVSALPIHVEARGFWALVYQLHLNATILAQWLPWASVFKLGVAGGTVAIKREVLEQIGGIEAIGDYVVEDVQLGFLVKEAGYGIAVGPEIYSPVGAKTKEDAVSLMARGAIIYRRMLHLALEVPYLVVAYFYLPLLLAGIMFLEPSFLWAAGIHLGCKMLTGFLISRTAGTSGAETLCIPIADCLFLYIYVRTVVSGDLTWRGISYRVDGKGRRLTS
ncbi:MAG TPA: glycosyltransferase [Clostridia bacterium]|nr:glycosyltransferase [Clostridia bacterium]